MVERPPSDRIQRKTSRIAFIGLAAAAMMITVSIVGAIQLQEASAAKPEWCYTNLFRVNCGFESNKDCRQQQSVDPTALTRCFNSNRQR